VVHHSGKKRLDAAFPNSYFSIPQLARVFEVSYSFFGRYSGKIDVFWFNVKWISV
jgi:hypothetical protein